MSQARTNRRYAKRMKMGNAHLSGLGVSRFAKQRSAAAFVNRQARARAKAAKQGRSFGYSQG